MPTLDIIELTIETKNFWSKFRLQTISLTNVWICENFESGSSIEAITELKPYGYQGFLIGKTSWKQKMREKQPLNLFRN
jgi:hypothetical protein